MNHFLFLILTLLSATCIAQNPIVQHVVTHNRTLIVTNPVKGVNPYPKWGLFPSDKFPVRKIVMSVTLGSPDSLPTAHWDYLDKITLRRKGGVNGKSLDFEIGRILTPYGSIYNKGWSWKWETDVTDFAPFLRDSVEIEYNHSGYEPTSVGWALTVDFEIVSGPPVVVPLGITSLWNDGFKYGDPKNKIEDSLLPIGYETLPGAAISRIRIQHTGHGMDKPKGCSEFCERWRDLKFDGATVDHRNMWKDCGANPLYPQGGTWLYDRAYWCPGDLQVPDVVDVKTIPGKHTVSISMEPYTATENIQAVENISAFLFQYSAPVQKLDVAVDQIIVPTNKQQYARLNPAGFGSQLLIHNLGSENLRTLTITYGTEGFPKSVFKWKGDLKFNAVEQVFLPGEINFKSGENKFSVTLSKPNGHKDGWEGDNELTSTFNTPEPFPTDFIVHFLTNNKPKDNQVYLVNAKSDTLYNKSRIGLEVNTLYKDTIHLKEGNYELCLADSAGDGLEFWAEPKNGDGYLRLFDIKGNLIHTFESDCGNGEKFSFHAISTFVTDTTQAKYAFSVYPRSITDKTTLSVVSNRTSKMTVLVTVNAVVLEKHEYTAIKTGLFSYDLGYLPTGRIVMEVLMDGVSKFKARLNKRK